MATEKVTNSQIHGSGAYDEKNASAVNTEPMVVYVPSSTRRIGTRSAITPITGLESATNPVDSTTPRLHIELPVKMPSTVPPSPTASLNRKTK